MKLSAEPQEQTAFAGFNPAIGKFDFRAPVFLFVRTGRGLGRLITYRKFLSGADAIRYVIEELSIMLKRTAILEQGGYRFDFDSIEHLYSSPAFPRQLA